MIQLEQKRFNELLALNNAHVPNVGELDEGSLRVLLSMAMLLS